MTLPEQNRTRPRATVAPNSTEWRTDPWNIYDSTGDSTFFWWNGCHAYLYRPD